jgi:hypothetical protein
MFDNCRRKPRAAQGADFGLVTTFRFPARAEAPVQAAIRKTPRLKNLDDLYL